MSEELLQEQGTQEEAEQTAETMADYEEHFDDANPWNVVKRYMEEKARLPIKIEGYCKWRSHCHGRGVEGIYPGFQIISFLY